jgi:hypothetical protein
MANSEVKDAIPFFVPIILFVIFSLIALLILPQDCSLFGNYEGPFSCDAIPNNCCKDTGVYTLVDQVLFCIGIGLTIGTVIFYSKQQSSNQSHKQPKLFE